MSDILQSIWYKKYVYLRSVSEKRKKFVLKSNDALDLVSW